MMLDTTHRENRLAAELAEWVRHCLALDAPPPGVDTADIRAQHAREIRHAATEHGPDAERIGDDLMLPTSLVKRHLEQLGLVAVPTVTDGGAVRLVAAELAKSGPATSGDLARATGLKPSTVCSTLSRHPERFRAGERVRRGAWTANLWELVEDVG